MKDGFNLKGRVQKDEAGIRYRHSSAIAHKFRNLDFRIWIQDPLPVDRSNKKRMSFKSHVGGDFRHPTLSSCAKPDARCPIPHAPIHLPPGYIFRT